MNKLFDLVIPNVFRGVTSFEGKDEAEFISEKVYMRMHQYASTLRTLSERGFDDLEEFETIQTSYKRLIYIAQEHIDKSPEFIAAASDFIHLNRMDSLVDNKSSR